MIPLKNIRESFEKNAGVGTRVLKLIAKNPRTSLAIAGGVGIAATGLSVLNSIAKNIHPAHQIYREETKNKSMKESNKMLREMLELQKKKSGKPTKKQNKIISPLS